jgi:hypothetical protein
MTGRIGIGGRGNSLPLSRTENLSYAESKVTIVYLKRKGIQKELGTKASRLIAA